MLELEHILEGLLCECRKDTLWRGAYRDAYTRMTLRNGVDMIFITN